MNREMYVYKSVAESRVTNAHHIIHSALTGSRSPAGPRRLGTATRISASLSRRLFAFFGSTLDQAPKAAKYAVLIPGPGMFVNVRNVPRVVIAPNPKCALFRRVSRCVRSFSERRVYCEPFYINEFCAAFGYKVQFLPDSHGTDNFSHIGLCHAPIVGRSGVNEVDAAFHCGADRVQSSIL